MIHDKGCQSKPPEESSKFQNHVLQGASSLKREGLRCAQFDSKTTNRAFRKKSGL